MRRRPARAAVSLLASLCLAAATAASSHPLLADEMKPVSPQAPAPGSPETVSLVKGDLPKLGADIAATSVSGLSSGAYMAGQIGVAHSKDIKGAGIVAGRPYACAETATSRLRSRA